MCVCVCWGRGAWGVGGGGRLNVVVAFPGFPRISIIMLLSGPAAFFVDIEHEIYPTAILSFPVRSFKIGSCQFLVKECALVLVSLSGD